MKSIGHYSKEKFATFSYPVQLDAIDKLIGALEAALVSEHERQKLIIHIIELSGLLSEAMPAKLHIFVTDLHPQLSAHQVLKKLYYYHDAALRKDSQLSIRTGDGSIKAEPVARSRAARITLICDNLRSVFNVGSIFRTAECLGVGEILLCGISPDPLHPNLPKTAMGTQDMVAWQQFANIGDAISYCRNRGMQIYALETVFEAVSVFKTEFIFPMALVLGNESLGIAPDTLKLCDKYITLPQLGWKNSLNVGVATAAALYQIIFGAPNG